MDQASRTSLSMYMFQRSRRLGYVDTRPSKMVRPRSTDPCSNSICGPGEAGGEGSESVEARASSRGRSL
jgi:hypothetical protein